MVVFVGPLVLSRCSPLAIMLGGTGEGQTMETSWTPLLGARDPSAGISPVKARARAGTTISPDRRRVGSGENGDGERGENGDDGADSRSSPVQCKTAIDARASASINLHCYPH